MPATTSEYSCLLELTTGKKQQPVQLSFNDTAFEYKDLSRGTCTFCSPTLPRLLTDIYPVVLPDVHVPLSHVLSAGISDSVVDVHVLEKSRVGLKLVKLSGSFQGDNAQARTSANDWVQAVMSAAYTGAWKVTHTSYHK
jgi:hypothetical protein